MRSKMLTVAIAAALGAVSLGAMAQAQDASTDTGSASKATTHKAARKRVQPITSSADKQEIELLKAQLSQLQAQVSALEQRTDAQSDINVSTNQNVQAVQQQVVAADQKVAAADKYVADAKSGKIDFKGITITPGGFLAAESVYRSRDTGDDINSKYSNIPMNGGTSTAPINTGSGATTSYPVTNARNDQFVYSSRQSRLSLLAQGDVNPDTHVTGYYEMDFLGGAQTANMNESNSYNPRVRQLWTAVDWDAYGLHLLGGQAWSLLTLNSVGITPGKEVLPPTIDAQYVPGFTWARQTQLRIVKDWDKMWWLGLSLENPQTAGIGSVAGPGSKGYTTSTGTVQAGNTYDTLNSVSLNHIPDIILKLAADPGWGHYEVFGLSRQFITRVTPVVGGATATNNQTAHGQGFGLGMLLPLIPKVLDFQFSGMTGKGIGRYGSSQLSDVTLTPNGAPQPLKENMLLATLTWHATPDFDVYVSGGREQQDSYLTTGLNGKAFGYGSALLGYNNSDCLVYGAPTDCTGQTRQIAQTAAGFWWKFYQGKFGRVQFGSEFSHTTRKLFSDINGYAPSAPDNMFFTSLRYYPF